METAGRTEMGKKVRKEGDEGVSLDGLYKENKGASESDSEALAPAPSGIRTKT
jgi:hypothetical protein